ncbi:MAG: RNA-binding protein [Rhizobiaceae bacterium]
MVERTCVVTRKVLEPNHLIRFVAGPDGQVVPDLKRTLPGRGVWVTAQQSVVLEAIKIGAFARGLKTNAKATSNLATLVEGLMEQQALGALGFARKAGECLTGSGKVEGSIRASKAITVLHAIDGAEDGLRKLSQATFAVHRDGGRKIKIWRVFSGQQMNLALGATNVIHASLIEGGAARHCLQRVVQLAKYREMETS